MFSHSFISSKSFKFTNIIQVFGLFPPYVRFGWSLRYEFSMLENLQRWCIAWYEYSMAGRLKMVGALHDFDSSGHNTGKKRVDMWLPL